MNNQLHGSKEILVDSHFKFSHIEQGKMACKSQCHSQTCKCTCTCTCIFDKRISKVEENELTMIDTIDQKVCCSNRHDTDNENIKMPKHMLGPDKDILDLIEKDSHERSMDIAYSAAHSCTAVKLNSCVPSIDKLKTDSSTCTVKRKEETAVFDLSETDEEEPLKMNYTHYRKTKQKGIANMLKTDRTDCIINDTFSSSKSSSFESKLVDNLASKLKENMKPDVDKNEVEMIKDGDTDKKAACHLKDVPKGKDAKRIKVAYAFSKDLVDKCDLMQKIPGRASMVHSLISTYGLLRFMSAISPLELDEQDILKFHTQEYVQFLKIISEQEDEEKFDEESVQFGLSYDCPSHKGVWSYASLVAGATVAAAEMLNKKQCDVAINWFGGWHHAQKDSASGFCYINDIVLGIMKLKESFSHVLYVDLDVHHGDGVENAFCASSSVMTVSVHKYTTGFFPGTGSLKEIGIGRGKGFSVNIPLMDGIKDQEFVPLVCRVLQKAKEIFQPDAVVCQCGADGVAGDPMDSFNLSHLGLAKCVYFLSEWKLPILLLGGGGYHHANTARCWAFISAMVMGKKLPTDIPEHRFFEEYGPDFELPITPGNRKDLNSKEYLKYVHRTIIENLDQITVG